MSYHHIGLNPVKRTNFRKLSTSQLCCWESTSYGCGSVSMRDSPRFKGSHCLTCSVTERLALKFKVIRSYQMPGTARPTTPTFHQARYEYIFTIKHFPALSLSIFYQHSFRPKFCDVRAIATLTIDRHITQTLHLSSST